MTLVKKLLDWLALRSVEPGLAQAQYRQLQRQIPLLYALLSVNAVAVAFTHHGTAPVWMTFWIPGLLVAVSAIRLLMWLRSPSALVTDMEALRHLRRTTILGAVISLAYICWSLKIGEYGNEHQQAHVAIFIAITVIGCIFCLMHLPQAAFTVTAIVTLPYLAYYVSPDDAVFTAVGLNILLVTLVMIRVLLNSFDGFSKLIRTQIETERLNKEITKLAHTDMLTGLPNRRLFFSEADASIGRCRREGRPLALGVIDLDRFKAANDTFGHLFGDQLLEAVGARLTEVFEGHGLVARLGGDEFGFILEAEESVVADLAARACQRLAEPFLLEEVRVSIGASCGIASIRDIPGSSRALYDGADYALYKSKSERRGFATLYSPEHERSIRSERAIEAALQVADLQNEMTVHLQPIASLNGDAVCAFEALARWTSPQLGSVRPDIFIPLAERTGIMHRLTLTLLEKALTTLKHVPGETRLSFNLSAHDITCTETIVAITSLVTTSGIDPSRLVLELTETAVVRDFTAAQASIRLLRALGIKIALDDFGTGQSSLSYLRRLPIDLVKIDRSFVAGAEEPKGRDLLCAIVAFCKSMGMKCVAEGVETASQLHLLRSIGCDEYQGYLLAKPMPIDELMLWEDSRVQPQWLSRSA
ncbi:diguanylate cyclase (GGDEF) domain-containing protein [Fulvimarina manganoxydans]|uniref:Diguanylate cyclase (GGDEF) domain-containing protein n=1 Tax=Fulvimarina manganoxydans TaxID=937218 RepID=A0A1W2ENI0_9HYPH|nr:EAL domain-containing protein [Fulvimarina manganoxydans]SMD10668.1 diguanylate cyclase (GGDEF) domain-containing protein [Fulvimarina manganoxydans]